MVGIYIMSGWPIVSPANHHIKYSAFFQLCNSNYDKSSLYLTTRFMPPTRLLILTKHLLIGMLGPSKLIVNINDLMITHVYEISLDLTR